MNEQSITEQELDARLRKLFGNTAEETLYALCFKAKPKELEQYALWHEMTKDCLKQLFGWEDAE